MPYKPEGDTYEAVKPNKEWKTTGRGPHVCVMAVAVDLAGNIPIIHRGPNVRSVKNAWSLVSGLHENGLSMAEQLAVELDEELQLKAVRGHGGEPLYCEQVGTYENIVVGNGTDEDDWHWVINVFVILVTNVHSYVNNEPDKHDCVKVVNIRELASNMALWTDEVSGAQITPKWTPGLGEFLNENIEEIRAKVKHAQDRAWSYVNGGLLGVEIVPVK